jgi:hypothetical protein
MGLASQWVWQTAVGADRNEYSSILGACSTLTSSDVSPTRPEDPKPLLRKRRVSAGERRGQAVTLGRLHARCTVDGAKAARCH